MSQDIKMHYIASVCSKQWLIYIFCMKPIAKWSPAVAKTSWLQRSLQESCSEGTFGPWVWNNLTGPPVPSCRSLDPATLTAKGKLGGVNPRASSHRHRRYKSPDRTANFPTKHVQSSPGQKNCGRRHWRVSWAHWMSSVDVPAERAGVPWCCPPLQGPPIERCAVALVPSSPQNRVSLSWFPVTL